MENRRWSDHRVVQRHVHYLGELNGRQEASWRQTVEVFGQEGDASRQMVLFPEAHAPEQSGEIPVVAIRLKEMSLRRPRQRGACWLGCGLWEQPGPGGIPAAEKDRLLLLDPLKLVLPDQLPPKIIKPSSP